MLIYRKDKMQAGLTLLEILITLLIISTVAALVTFNVANMAPKKRLHKADTAVTRLLMQARNLAQTRGQPIAVRIESNKLIVDAANIDLPVHPSVEVVSDVEQLIIFEDGSASGAQLRLSTNGLSREITVEPFTGRIVHHE